MGARSSKQTSSAGKNSEETDMSLAALDKVYTVLVEYMVPDPVLDNLLELGFHQRLIQDIRGHRLTSDKNIRIIEAVEKGGCEAYAKFKSSLTQCGQELMCSLLERAEKGEKTSDLQNEIRDRARRKLESEKNELCKGKNSEETDMSLAALDKVYTVLVDYMVPDPVLDNLVELGFHQRLIQDIREQRLTSDKNKGIIEAVEKGGCEAYAKFKSSLMQCGQELICSLLEREEKGENTSDLQDELRDNAREQRKLKSENNNGRNSEEKDASLAALDKVYTVLVDYMVPDPVLDNLLELGFHQSLIKDIREQRVTNDKNKRIIEAVEKGGCEAYANFKSSLMQCGQELICFLLERAEKGENTSDLQDELRDNAREQRKLESENNKLCKDLKEDLVTYYRGNESHIPASPLVDEHSVPIEDLFVLPPLRAYGNSYNFGPCTNKQKKDHNSGNDVQYRPNITVNQLFLSGNVRYRKIYITANAGFGKTSLSQKLTMTWCQAHSPFESLTEKYESAELEAMKYFDFLFLLHLRDYRNKPECKLDALIMQMVSETLSGNALYTKEFVQRILHKNKCIIIFDGLDEWTHPGDCPRKPEVPHNNHPGTCTVLTTTRDWKIGTIGLSPKDIDRRVEISMLDNKTSNLLEKNAIGILNDRNLNLAEKTLEDFDKEIKKVPIGNIIYIPYILLQLMCLFFGGLPIGKSKCEIYSNITEFTLERGLNRKDLPDIHLKSTNNAAVPNCMKENETCRHYFNLLIRLGKLAFYTLFSENKESCLVFDKRIVTQYMTETEIEFSLKVGLLCQTKDYSIIAVKRFHVFFQHKSVQEFFAALYLTSEWQNESVKSTILQVCSSLSSNLEMENLFVFACGMNPKVYTCISRELQKIIKLDNVTRRCRIDKDCDDDARKLRSYQSMQEHCLQESMRNGNESYPIDLYIVLDNYLFGRFPTVELSTVTLKTIVDFNKGHVTSLLISWPYDKSAAFIQSLDPGVFTSLESLKVDRFSEEPVWLADILTRSARTLKCLTLILSANMRSLSVNSLTALTGLTCLQSLDLVHVYMAHSDFKCLYDYINKTTTLTQLKLKFIYCLDHWYQYRDCDVTLDIHRLNKLGRVKLVGLSMSPDAWQKLLLKFGVLSFSAKVKFSHCRGPSRQEWQTIVNVIKATPTLSILPDLRISELGFAYLTLKNKP